MAKPRLLDLFCGAGGAAMGYHRAGFEVVGVDIKPQPHYPFPFIRADAIEYLNGLWDDMQHGGRIQYDAIHASPPCQGYSPHVSSRSSRWAGTAGQDEPRMIGWVRELLVGLNKPYVIENVYGARSELRGPMLLCGTMFGLPIPRHRMFEVSPRLIAWPPSHPKCAGRAREYALAKGWDPRDMTVTGKGRRAGTGERWAEVMGIDWPMTQHEMREAIPPSYTEFLGHQLLSALTVAA